MAKTAPNTLYYGDNLAVLREHIEDESVDLIYLDPPFNSNADYNVLFAEKDHTESAAQIKAFEDTWKWDSAAAEAFHEAVQSGHGRVPDAMNAFQTFLGQSDMLAYLSMMAPRLIELHRVLKSTGSLYLHCDPTASHYLKMLLDAVFDPRNFRNEITWKRTHAHGSAKRFGPVHDTILFYSTSNEYLWTHPRIAHDEEYLDKHFKPDNDGRLYQAITLTGAGTRTGHSGKPWRGVDPTESGRHWAIPGKVMERLGLKGGTVQECLDLLDQAGRIFWPKKQDGKPRLRWYADELEGVAIPDVWTDIDPISAQAAERLGYPTQKPEALLERIISASSNEGDIVLDPFCGCGTTIAAAQKLKRRWIGIDVTHLAVNLIKHRLFDTFLVSDKSDPPGYRVVGEPVTLTGAEQLAEEDRFQFQAWALSLVKARVTGSDKRGADKGIDGRLFFHDEPDRKSASTKQVILSVKSGKVNVSQVRDLRGVVEREKNAAIGVLITLQPPTAPMRQEAASAGIYDSPWGTKPARLQILTIEGLLKGNERIGMPQSRDLRTFKKAPRSKKKAKDAKLFD